MSENHHDDLPVDDNERTETSASGPSPPSECIDHYRLLQKLGEGGMGVVWLAEQTEPIKRRVALKIIKSGMDTKQVVARFEAERQALAMMNHPNVAKVLDAGSTPQGRPYFVMEHVPGVSIIEHCDTHKLTNRERLKLFIQVCEGVQHAHQKAIIHRDLKPSNILVTVRDGQAIPKIIDFGLAKATAQPLTEKTMFTELGVLIGTPEYMSPEQAEMTGQDVDTRTDVYSLGVLLYKLLTGALPFDSEDLRRAGLDGIRRKIRDEQPPKPSTRVSSPDEDSVETAKKHRTDPQTLQRQLSGDLDWITMKALEKDRTRRYNSAKELADEIERYLTAQPVVARPPSKMYLLRKFIRRNRAGVIAGLLVFAALIIGAVAATVGFLRASEAQRRAEAEARTAEKISEFVFLMIDDANPAGSGSRELTIEDMILRALPRIDTELEGELEAQAALRWSFADAVFGLGDFEKAITLKKQAIENYIELEGENSPHAARVMHSISWTLQKNGKFDEAIETAERGLAIARRLYNEDNFLIALFLNVIGDTYRYKFELEIAESTLREAYDMYLRLRGNVPSGVKNNLALVYQFSSNPEKAETLFRENFEESLKLHGEEAFRTQLYLENLAGSIRDQGRLDEALGLYQSVLEIRKRVLGPEHPYTLWTKRNVAEVLLERGQSTEAEDIFRELLVVHRIANFEPDAAPSNVLNGLGRTLLAQHRYQEAEECFRECLEIRRKKPNSDSWLIPSTMSDLGDAVARQGRYEEAESLLLEAHADLSPPEYFMQQKHRTLEHIVWLYEAWGKPDKADEWRARHSP